MKTFKANKAPLTKDRIKEQLSKLNDTPYKLANIKIDIDDNILIPIKELNQLRRNVVEKLINLRTQIDDRKIDKLKEIGNKKVNSKICINALVKTEEQLLTCIKNNIDNIYVDKNLYNKYKDKYTNLILTLPRICNNYIEYNKENLQVRSIGELKYYKNNNLYIDYTLNTTNTYNIDLLKHFNTKLITLSVELEDSEIKNILDKTNENLEVILYGNLEIFITKYCILNKHVNKNKICKTCKNNNKYYLIDRKNEKYEIINEDCTNILLSSNKINKLDKYNYYKDLGIYNFRLNFYNETSLEVKKIIKSIKRM